MVQEVLLFASKEKRLALGSYPAVSLKQARSARDLARRTLQSGSDPSKRRQIERLELQLAEANTFEEVARELHATKASGWSKQCGERWLERMEKDLFWTLDGPEELQLFILARNGSGPAKGPGSLACVQLPLRTPGVSLTGRRPQGPVPELPHTEVIFDGVQVPASHLLPGDGYSDYAKPFRLREDVFVTGCTLAYLLGEGRLASWPTTWAQQCVAAIAGLHACSTLDPHSPGTHVLTAGVLSWASEVIHESEFLWGRNAPEKLGRWHRDLPLFSLGREARRQRVIKSWRSIGWKVPEHSGLGDHTSGSLVVW